MFKNNRASGTWGRDQYGGAIYCTNLKCNNCTFEDNYSNDDAGAIYIKTKSESTIKNTQFTNNQAKDNNGGAIYSNGDLRVSNCNFTKNKAKTDGGAIYINNKGKSTIKNSKFTNNKADDYNRGAIYSKKNIEVYNSLFKNNQANNSWFPSTSQGGAIYCGTITCNNCTFENNKAKKYAGAIYINDKEVSTIKNSKFINNTSPFNGGAINANGKLIVESSIFKNNKADHFGGALEPYENGGAIFCLNIDCNNSTFENNYAESYGGAIFIKNEGKSTIKNSKFINNTAKLNGGAIYLDNTNSHVDLIHNIFEKNTAERGNEGLIVYTYGEFDKISQNYYGTENPNWSSHLLYEQFQKF